LVTRPEAILALLLNHPGAIRRLDKYFPSEVQAMSTSATRVNGPIAKRICFDTALTATTPKRMLADIRELALDIKARAAEIEAGRRIPVDLVEALRSIGVSDVRAAEPRRAGA
jgi:hypothetical protein